MSRYTVTVTQLQPHERDEAYLREIVQEEWLEGEDYGVVESIVVEGDTARIAMTGGTEQFRELLDGKTFEGLLT
jgi:hypothetical protein